MYNIGSFIIDQRPILSSRVVPVWKHQRSVFTSSVDLLIRQAIQLNLAHVFLSSEAVLFISRGHERSHPFIQPEMIPVAARHHVTPPLMGEFMRPEPHIALVRQDFTAVGLTEDGEAAHLLVGTTRR